MLTGPSLDPKGKRKINLATGPTVEPVTVDEVKEWARIDGTDEDTILTGMIKSVRAYTEAYLRRALISQKYEMIMDYWISDSIELPYPPLISVDSVVTIDEDDTETTYSSSYYYLSGGEPDRLCIKEGVSLPENDDRACGGFKITWYAGYGTTADDVPQQIKDAIKAWVTYTYEQRVMNPDPPLDVKGMLRPYRVLRI